MGEVALTDTEFDVKFKKMTIAQKYRWLGENCVSVKMINGQQYRIFTLDDLDAAIKQELYEELTGRM